MWARLAYKSRTAASRLVSAEDFGLAGSIADSVAAECRVQGEECSIVNLVGKMDGLSAVEMVVHCIDD